MIPWLNLLNHMSIFDAVGSLLGSLPLNEVLRERFALVQDQIKGMETELVNLKAENAQLKKENAKLKEELLVNSESQDFIESRGALFKRIPSGGFDPDAYCKFCRIPMVSLQGYLPFKCTSCNRTVNFTGRDLRGIVSKL